MPGISVWLSWLEIMKSGLLVTAELSVLGAAITTVLAFAISLCAVSRARVLRAFARGYVDLFRSIPILALMIFLYVGVGAIVADFGISAFWLALAALSLSSAAYLAEIYRGAMASVPQSQWRAAASLGIGHASTLRLVVIPQVLPPMVPSTLNVVISLIKNSSLASLITVQELTLTGTLAVAQSFLPMHVYLLLGAMYAVIITPLIYASRYLERWIAKRYGLVSAQVTKRLTGVRDYGGEAERAMAGT